MQPEFHGQLFIPILFQLDVVVILPRIKLRVDHAAYNIQILQLWNTRQAIASHKRTQPHIMQHSPIITQVSVLVASTLKSLLYYIRLKNSDV